MTPMTPMILVMRVLQALGIVKTGTQLVEAEIARFSKSMATFELGAKKLEREVLANVTQVQASAAAHAALEVATRLENEALLAAKARAVAITDRLQAFLA